MTIGTEPPIIRYVYANPATFHFNFRITAEESLAVGHLDGASGIVSLLELTTDYTVSLADGVDGGSITILNATLDPGWIEIRRAEAIDQETDYVNNDPFNMDILERSLDKLTMIAQQQATAIALGTLVATFRGVWETATAYRINEIVQYPDNQGNQYICRLEHTSSDFPADLAAGRWLLYLDVQFISSEANRASAAADSATISASAANSSAVAASGSASQALVSQNAAKVSQDAAKVSETNSKTSETNSKSSETFAKQWASNPNNVLVNDGVNPPDFSAKHYAHAALVEGAYTRPEMDTLLTERESIPTSIHQLDSPTEILNATQIRVHGGTGHYVDSYDLGNPALPDAQVVAWIQQDITLSMPLDIGIVYIYIDSGGVLRQHSAKPTPSDIRTKIYMAAAYYELGAIVTIDAIGVVAQQQGNTLLDFLSFVDAGVKLEGFTVQPNTGLSLTRDLGRRFGVSVNWMIDSSNPNIRSYPSLTPAPFTYILATGAIPVLFSVTDVIPGQYESPLGVLTPVTLGSFTIQYLYMSTEGNQVMQYGQFEYLTLDDALRDAADDRLNSSTAPIIDSMILLAQIVVQDSATDLSDTNEAKIINIAAASSSGSGTGSATTWTALSDTDVALVPHATPVANQVGTVLQMKGSAIYKSDVEPPLGERLDMMEWWDTSTGDKWIWIIDADSAQWIAIDSPANDYNLEENFPTIITPANNPSVYTAKNVLINGAMTGPTMVNQRGFTDWASEVTDAYGPDRWRKKAAGDMEQLVEDGNYRPSTPHFLSANGAPIGSVMSPAGGSWSIVVPDTSQFLMLEEGDRMTKYEWLKLTEIQMLCYRYYFRYSDVPYGRLYGLSGTNKVWSTFMLPVTMRAIPVPSIIVAPSLDNATLVSIYAYQSYGQIRLTVSSNADYHARGGVYDFDAELTS